MIYVICSAIIDMIPSYILFSLIHVIHTPNIYVTSPHILLNYPHIYPHSYTSPTLHIYPSHLHHLPSLIPLTPLQIPVHLNMSIAAESHLPPPTLTTPNPPHRYPCTSLCLWQQDLIVAAYSNGQIHLMHAETGDICVEIAAHSRWITSLDIARTSGMVIDR